MSFSRPTFSSYCATGGALRAKRDGCLPLSPGCSPATAGGIRVRASSTGSFAWPRGVPALLNVSVFTHCGTASPPISWSRRPTFGSSRFFSERRHTAHEHLVEGRIYYRFHPRFGETVLIRRQLEYRGVELVVVLQPDGSLACTPAWMTREAAAQYALSEKPRFSVDILRSLRAAADVLLRSLLSEPKTEKADNAAPIQKPATEPVRGRGASRRSGGRTDERSGGSGGSPAARDRDCTGEQGDRR